MSLLNAFSKIYTDLKDYIDKSIEDGDFITIEDVQAEIVSDNLNEQKWKPPATSDPTITGDEQGVTWLYKNTNTNMVRQRVAGQFSEWENYGSDTDFVDPTELSSAISTHDSSSSAHSDIRSSISGLATTEGVSSAIGTHNSDNTAHTDIRTSISTLDGSVVKLTGTQSIAGVKTFTDEPIVPTPTYDTSPVTKLYADNLSSDLEESLEDTIDSVSATFRTANSLGSGA